MYGLPATSTGTLLHVVADATPRRRSHTLRLWLVTFFAPRSWAVSYLVDCARLLEIPFALPDPSYMARPRNFILSHWFLSTATTIQWLPFFLLFSCLIFCDRRLIFFASILDFSEVVNAFGLTLLNVIRVDPFGLETLTLFVCNCHSG